MQNVHAMMYLKHFDAMSSLYEKILFNIGGSDEPLASSVYSELKMHKF